jgi:hypothetical protein
MKKIKINGNHMFFGSKYFQKTKKMEILFDFYFYYYKKTQNQGLFENEITTPTLVQTNVGWVFAF